MKVKITAAMVLALLGVVTVMVLPALSEDVPANDMEVLHEKIRADKKLFVAENLQLTETEAEGFWPVYERYQDEQFLLRARAMKMINDYSEAYEMMTNETARRLLDEYMTIEFLDLAVRQVYLSEFRKVLPETKVVRYYQIENKIKAVLVYELAGKIPLMKMGK
jgi:hypothetical protein